MRKTPIAVLKIELKLTAHQLDGYTTGLQTVSISEPLWTYLTEVLMLMLQLIYKCHERVSK